MTISFNPNISFTRKSVEPKTVAAYTSNGERVMLSLEDNEPKKKSGLKGGIAKAANFFVNLGATAKGLLSGIFVGAVGGTVVAGVDWVTNAPKAFAKVEPIFKEGEGEAIVNAAKKAAGEQRLSNIKNFFKHPAKQISKTAKVLSWVTAVSLLGIELLKARLKANKKTADIDHQLRVDHRDNGKKVF